jgi:hypothetical protein
MTERTEIRFSFYNTTSDYISFGNALPYNIENFNIGGGVFNNTAGNYNYTFSVDGTFIIGYSYSKTGSSNSGHTRIMLTRTTDGITTTEAITATQKNSGSTTGGGLSMNNFIIYQFKEGDIIYIYTPSGAPRMNNLTLPTGDNIHNSWWGIRLDY